MAMMPVMTSNKFQRHCGRGIKVFIWRHDYISLRTITKVYTSLTTQILQPSRSRKCKRTMEANLDGCIIITVFIDEGKPSAPLNYLARENTLISFSKWKPPKVHVPETLHPMSSLIARNRCVGNSCFFSSRTHMEKI